VYVRKFAFMTLTYENTKSNEKRFLSLTSLKVLEFDFLLKQFEPISENYFRWHTLHGQLRVIPKYESRSNETLPTHADKLFFLMVYLKNAPLQEFQGANFGISQGKVSRIVKILNDLLLKTLSKLKLIPCRSNEDLQNVLEKHPDNTFSMDATERRVARNIDYESQKELFSGKKKDHTVKNNIIFDDSSEVLFLSQTYEGKIHDKAICDEDNYYYPKNTNLRVDLGYLAYNPANVTIIIPVKKQKKVELLQEIKDQNKLKSKDRVVAEHGNSGIKRLRSLTDRLRLKLIKYQDSLMVIGCALHNLRVRSPLRNYTSRTGTLPL
jgi:hypothetical protein